MSLENKGGCTQKWVENTMAGEGGAVNTATYMPRISEEQAPAHMGFIIPEGLFVHNIKGHLESATVRDRKLPEEWAQKGCVRRWPVTREGGAAGPSC